MPRILIAPNSFKECADSVTVAELISKNLLEKTADKSIQLELIIKPVSDGGDGFLEVCDKLFDLEFASTKIPAPFNSGMINCEFGYSEKNKTVYFELAKVLGLNLIPFEKRHPLNLNSAGLGILLKYLQKEKQEGKLSFDKVIIGIGGTGTSDFGIGMMSAFNLKLIDSNEQMLEPFPYNFDKTNKIIFNNPNLSFEIEVVADVNIPLLGENGAAKLFAKQKGATESEIIILENGLQNIVKLFEADDKEKLCGAGGGLAGAFQFFFKSKVTFADEFIKTECGINRNLKPDFVITGEGKFDYQSGLNKAVGIILNEFSEDNIPLFVICGKSDARESISSNVTFIELESFFKNKTESIINFSEGISRATELILKKISRSLFN